VALNRGYLRERRTDTGERPVDFYILPMSEVERVCEGAAKWGESSKVYLRRISDVEQYRDAWGLIVEYLAPTASGG
jgi:hypothetical protein